MRVAVVGASNKPERYSYKAMKDLEAQSHEVFLVNPVLKEVEGRKVYASLNDLSDIHTVTIYVGPDKSSELKSDLIKLAPKRIIFNPGAENESLEKALLAEGIEVLSACTLVMLSIKRF